MFIWNNCAHHNHSLVFGVLVVRAKMVGIVSFLSFSEFINLIDPAGSLVILFIP